MAKKSKPEQEKKREVRPAKMGKMFDSLTWLFFTGTWSSESYISARIYDDKST